MGTYPAEGKRMGMRSVEGEQSHVHGSTEKAGGFGVRGPNQDV